MIVTHYYCDVCAQKMQDGGHIISTDQLTCENVCTSCKNLVDANVSETVEAIKKEAQVMMAHEIGDATE